MDLLNENTKKKETPKSKKIVLTLLIVSIVVLVLMILLIVLIKLQPTATKEFTLNVDNKETELTTGLIIENANGTKYISLKDLSNVISYTYYNGGYLEYTEDIQKCYLGYSSQIVGFEAGSNEIYKTKENSNLDYQYYTLINPIIMDNNKLYIALEDAGQALNLLTAYSNDTFKIYTLDYLIQEYDQDLQDKGYEKLNTDYNEKSLLSYSMLMVKKNNKTGVINLDFEEVIGVKYDTMKFDEYTMNFIVSNNGKYGVINQYGTVKINLEYSEISIINYEPGLYQVKKNKKYGIIDFEGNTIVPIEYEKIGCNGLVVLPDVDGKIGKTIIVSKSEKEPQYSLISAETGELVFGDYYLDKIFVVTEGKETIYKIIYSGKECTLLEFIEAVNTVTVNLN